MGHYWEKGGRETTEETKQDWLGEAGRTETRKAAWDEPKWELGRGEEWISKDRTAGLEWKRQRHTFVQFGE